MFWGLSNTLQVQQDQIALEHLVRHTLPHGLEAQMPVQTVQHGERRIALLSQHEQNPCQGPMFRMWW